MRLRGLQRRAEFNGQCGELQPAPECSPAAAGGGGGLRWHVRLEGGAAVRVEEARLVATLRYP